MEKHLPSRFAHRICDWIHYSHRCGLEHTHSCRIFQPAGVVDAECAIDSSWDRNWQDHRYSDCPRGAAYANFGHPLHDSSYSCVQSDCLEKDLSLRNEEVHIQQVDCQVLNTCTLHE